MPSFETSKPVAEYSGEVQRLHASITALRGHLTQLVYGISHNTEAEKKGWQRESRTLLADIHPDRHDDEIHKRIAKVATRVVDAYAGKVTAEDLNGLLSQLDEIEKDLGYSRPAWAPKNSYESAEARPVDWGAEKK